MRQQLRTSSRVHIDVCYFSEEVLFSNYPKRRKYKDRSNTSDTVSIKIVINKREQ